MAESESNAGTEAEEVSLAIRAVFDAEQESVGVEAHASEAFDAGEDTRAKIEVTAAIAARANGIAADLIHRWDADEERKRALFDHFAALKENMLNEMLEQMDKPAEE
jgi:hypothetical protein